jgi:hypothetical protein
MVDIVREEHAKEPRTLFVIGAYSIGKVRRVARPGSTHPGLQTLHTKLFKMTHQLLAQL